MNYRKIIKIFILFGIIFISCNKNESNNIKNPQELLLKIAYLDKIKNYEEMKKYIYNIKDFDNIKNYNSQEKIIQGIKDKNDFGLYQYSTQAMLFHIQFVNLYTQEGTKELVQKYLIDSKIITNDKILMNLAKKNPEKFLFYFNNETILVFVEINNSLYWLVTHIFNARDMEKIDWSKVKWIE